MALVDTWMLARSGWRRSESIDERVFRSFGGSLFFCSDRVAFAGVSVVGLVALFDFIASGSPWSDENEESLSMSELAMEGKSFWGVCMLADDESCTKK